MQADECQGEVELDLHLTPLVLEFLRILDKVFLHLFGFLHVEQFESAFELADGLLVLFEDEVDASLNLVHIPKLEYLAVFLILPRK